VGLGLDFTEIDLWWLLLHKRRRAIQSGHTFYYNVRVPAHGHQAEAPQLSVLRSLGMTVVTVEADTYAAGYDHVLHELSLNITQNPELRESTRSLDYKRNAKAVATQTVDPSRIRARDEGAQLGLNFKRKGRTSGRRK
jgi:hypothetical protein